MTWIREKSTTISLIQYTNGMYRTVSMHAKDHRLEFSVWKRPGLITVQR